MPGRPLRKIASNELPDFWRNERLPTPQQQANNLILWIGDNQDTIFGRAEIHRSALAAWIGLPISNDDLPAWNWLNSALIPQQLYKADHQSQTITTHEHAANILLLQLTMKGWERHAQLKKTEIESRTAFMALKFDKPDANRLVEECVRPAVKRAGFELRVFIDPQPAGHIDNQLRAAILAARFVIADLTHGSSGAYWEAGFGEGLGLPVIYTCEKTAWQEQGTHFDTNHLNTIIWDVADLKKAEDRLTATIRATFRADAKQTDDDGG
jgi:hypothetical protein